MAPLGALSTVCPWLMAAEKAAKRYRTPFGDQRVDLLDVQVHVLGVCAAGEVGVRVYAWTQALREPMCHLALPRARQVSAPGGTVHVAARCNHGEFHFTTRKDFAVLPTHLC